MKAKFYLGAALGAVVLAGVGVELRGRAATEGVPFISPLSLLRSACGGEAGAPGAARAYFLRIAEAVAAQAPASSPAAALVPTQTGAIAYDISTSNPMAQAHFNAGLAHMWNFNHGAAIASFKAAQAADPQCAMCFWAEALAHGPNINAPMDEDAVAPAWAAIKSALSLIGGASDKEKDLIRALGYRYQEKPIADRSKLDAAFADAMDAVAKKYPGDDFVLALAAEANMDTQPWDYWEADGRTPKGRTDRTLALVETVLDRNPEHAAAIHLYIHVTENTQNPYRATKFADRLAQLSPGLGHLIHMPSHTYYRIGRFKASIELNVAAVAADEAFLATHAASPMYEFGYYVHNIHFVLTSAQMAGDAVSALAMAGKLDEKLPKEMLTAAPFAEPIKAAPYFALAQFAEPETVLRLDDPGKEFPLLQAAWRYARGEALARAGDAAAVRREAAAIAQILAEADLSTLEANRVPARGIIEIAQLTISARADSLDGDLASAIDAMTLAVAAQEGLNYTEPPYWYYPAKQTLAALVLQDGDSERAEQLFLEALVESPNNGWALYGLSEAYRAQGDRNGAKFAAGLFKDAWAGDRKGIALGRL